IGLRIIIQSNQVLCPELVGMASMDYREVWCEEILGIFIDDETLSLSTGDSVCNTGDARRRWCPERAWQLCIEPSCPAQSCEIKTCVCGRALIAETARRYVEVKDNVWIEDIVVAECQRFRSVVLRAAIHAKSSPQRIHG